MIIIKKTLDFCNNNYYYKNVVVYCNVRWLFFSSQFNFVGKLLGPRGNTFKRLQANTGTKMSILGKGSMREKEKVS